MEVYKRMGEIRLFLIKTPALHIPRSSHPSELGPVQTPNFS